MSTDAEISLSDITRPTALELDTAERLGLYNSATGEAIERSGFVVKLVCKARG